MCLVEVSHASKPHTGKKQNGEGESGGEHKNTPEQKPNRDSTPPSTDATWRPTRLVRMQSVKVSQQSGAQNERPAHPGAILWTVTLPVDQVLVASTPSAHIQEPADCVGWVPVD